MVCLVAIDPGVCPAVCVLFDEPGKLLAADFFDGDDTSITVTVGRSKRHRPSAPLLVACLRPYLLSGIAAVVVEDVATHPGEGAVGAFSFGYSRGLIEGVVHTLGLPLITVRPQVWKKRVGLPAKSSKGQSRHAASSLAPNLASNFKLVKDHNRADAFLMAWWGRGQL